MVLWQNMSQKKRTGLLRNICMNNKQIKSMLKDLLSEIDYDIYKSYFEYDEDSDEYQDPSVLIHIIQKHLDMNRKKK